MRRERLIEWKRAAGAIAAVAAITTAGACASSTPVTVVENVNVIVGDGSAPVKNQDVVIAGGVIRKIEDADAYRAPGGAHIINGDGKYLLPGFIDTHAHIALGPVSMTLENGTPVFAVTPLPELTDISMKMLLEYGVTTARDPGGSTELAVTTRDRQARGELEGPGLQVAGELIDLSRFDNILTTVANADDVIAEIDRQAEIGVDWIKLYTSLPPELTQVAINAAHARTLKVTGHLDATTWTEAAEMGIDSIVHIIPGSASFLPEEAREEYAHAHRLSLFMLQWFELADFDAPQIQEMIDVMRENNVSLDPTLVLFHAMANGDGDIYLANPALAGLPEEMIDNWKTLFNFNIGWTPEDFETARRIWPHVLEFTKLLHESGIMLTAGTDANNPWVAPGDSFHTELQLLVDADIPPVDVLTIATRNGAILMGIEEEVGTVEVGKRADLVLLDADPLADIANTRRIRWVMQNGEIRHGASTEPSSGK